MKSHACLAGLLAAAFLLPAQAEDIVRRPLGDFPIASSIIVPAGTELVLLSGTLADVAKPGAPSQGKLPTRTTVQVVALPIPGALVGIEAIAARKAATAR